MECKLCAKFFYYEDNDVDIDQTQRLCRECRDIKPEVHLAHLMRLFIGDILESAYEHSTSVSFMDTERLLKILDMHYDLRKADEG